MEILVIPAQLVNQERGVPTMGVAKIQASAFFYHGTYIFAFKNHMPYGYAICILSGLKTFSSLIVKGDNLFSVFTLNYSRDEEVIYRTSTILTERISSA